MNKNNIQNIQFKPENSLLFLLIISLLSLNSYSQQRIILEKGEKWYGAAVNDGEKMPFENNYTINLNNNTATNQAAPLLLSNCGRYIWSKEPFSFKITSKDIFIDNCTDSIITEKSGTTLKDAYMAVSKKYFPASGKLPDSLLFTSPQYNTWIELIYNQNQSDILAYAHKIIDNGFPHGVLMIDDNWAPYYGCFDFREDRFPDATSMVKELKNMGFKIMVWISPFISPDSEVGRWALKEKLVLMSQSSDNPDNNWEFAKQPAIVNWWNGYSFVLDFTNPKAVEWYEKQLNHLKTTYDIDGFKFDAGDPEYYPSNSISFKQASGNQHTELWGSIGLKYKLNEYRAMWKNQNKPLVERLRDKLHTWADLQKLIPHITTASLLGYTFSCPDMIGGGDYSSFIDNANLDQDLIVRSAQCQALMPMMQFSVAPWRILDNEHLVAVKNAVKIRQRFVPFIMDLAKESALSGTPIVSRMEYYFPHQGFEACKDQFMLGEKYLIAPVVEKAHKRNVVFPKGSWKTETGTVIKGPCIKSFDVPLNELLWFEKIK